MENVETPTTERERLMDALKFADAYLHKLQTPGSEPLNSLNSGPRTGPTVARIRNEAREVWAVLGHVMAGKTVEQAKTDLGLTPRSE